MGMFLDGILTAPHIDTSGERLLIEGVDLTDFYEGKAVINFEHQNKLAEDIIGAFVYCKKIMKKDDCETARQKMFFELAKGPYVYVVGELYDEEGHPGAVAAAAMVRYYAKRKEKMFIGWSIEGSTLERDGNDLKQAVARRAAFTLRPCLKSAVMGTPEADEINKLLDKMDKSESKLFVLDSDKVILDEASFPVNNPVLELHKALEELNKTLTAGQSNVAPSQLTGGAALTKEHIAGSVKNRIKAAVRDWNRTRPLKETIKAALPEVSDEYVDHFTDIAEDLALKKGMAPLTRIGQKNAAPNHNDENKGLLEGIYLDPASVNGTHNLKTKNDAGQDVVLQHTASKASVYNRIARGFFNLNDHVPAASAFSHPSVNGGQIVQAFEHKKGVSPYQSEEAWSKALDKARLDGSAHKIMITDHILGLPGRNLSNIVIDEDGKLQAIDNHKALSFATSPSADLHSAMQEDHPTADVLSWIQQKDPKILAKMLYNNQVDQGAIKKAVARLRRWQIMMQSGVKMGDVLHAIHGTEGGLQHDENSSS